MSLKRMVASAAVCSAVILSVGCKSTGKDDFIEFDKPQPIIAENIVMETEFPEYDGDTERILVKLKNNTDEDFFYGRYFFLQKLDSDEWRYIGVSGDFQAILYSVPPAWDGWEYFELKDHVKQPLQSGTYRIGFWVEEGKQPTPVAEFTVK